MPYPTVDSRRPLLQRRFTIELQRVGSPALARSFILLHLGPETQAARSLSTAQASGSRLQPIPPPPPPPKGSV